MTLDPDGGPCDGCLVYIEEMEREFWADQAEAFPWHLR